MAKNLEEIRLKCEKSKKKEYNASIVQIDKATKGLKSFVCFSLEQDENSGQMVFTYKLKEKAIKERKNSYGKFVIITRRTNLSNKEMLEYYLSICPIEDAYRTLKSDMEIDTPNHLLTKQIPEFKFMMYCCNGVVDRRRSSHGVSDAWKSMDAADFASKTLDHLGIVSAVCREINVAGVIDRIVGVDPRQKVTCGRCHGPERAGIRGPTTVPIPGVHGNKARGGIDKGRFERRGLQR
jgi:ribosomal protein L30E